MITLQELCVYLREFLSVPLYKDSAENGIQVEGAPEIRHIATAVSASLSTISAAAAQGVQALIVHHGMFWQGDPYEIAGSKNLFKIF